jgi:uncharacterized protein YbaR (Trm112 family)
MKKTQLRPNQIERQELYCHGCGNYVQFNIDLSLNGNHVLKCPKCKHEHCRVVKDGQITEDRWDSRNYTFMVSGPITISVASACAASSSYYLQSSWSNAAAY